jgi:hypothetical protein
MLSRRRFLLAAGALALVACGDSATIATLETSGEVAKPGAPGVAEPIRVGYTLRRPAAVSAVLGADDGREWPLRAATPRTPGEPYQIAFDGTVPAGPGQDRAVLADGAYELRLIAVESDGRTDRRAVAVRVESADAAPLELDGPTLSLSAISPDGDGVDDEARISYRLGKEATVEIWAYDEKGGRATIQAPTRRPAGEHAVLWDGSAGGRVFGGKRLVDGQYAVALRAWDAAGNSRHRELPLRILNGGIERVEVAEVRMTPERLRIGETLRLRARVVNTGETTVRTAAPRPDAAQATDRPFATIPEKPSSGAWRLGLGWATQDQELPIRWGLLPDPTGTIPPGGEAVVEAEIVVAENVLTNVPDGQPVRFFVGVVREGIGMSGGRVGDHLVTVAR